MRRWLDWRRRALLAAVGRNPAEPFLTPRFRDLVAERRLEQRRALERRSFPDGNRRELCAFIEGGAILRNADRDIAMAGRNRMPHDPSAR